MDDREPQPRESNGGENSRGNGEPQPRVDIDDHPEQTTGGTGTLPQGGVPNPGFTARGD